MLAQDQGLGTPTRYLARRVSWNTDLEIGKSVRCFQGRDDALLPGHMLERFQRLSIGYCVILGTPNVAEVTVLWADAWIV